MASEAIGRGMTFRSAGSILVLVLLSYALGFAAYWHFLFIFDPRFETIYTYQRDLLAGHTEWVADQNRVLAPLLVEGLRRALHLSYEGAYQHYMFYMFVAETLCAALLFRICRLSMGQSLVGLLLVTTVPLALMNLWWFSWTNLEFTIVLLTFALDASRIGRGMRIALYGCLFAAWVFTKETSFFLAVWIGLRYGLPALGERRWKTLGLLAALCLGMVAVSAAVVSGLRHGLFVSGTNPAYPSGMPDDLPTVLGGTHLYSMNPVNVLRVVRNYRAFLTFRLPWPLWGNRHFLDWSVGMIEMLTTLAILVGCAIWAFWHQALRLLALALMGLIYVVMLFLITNTAEADKLMPVVAMGAYAYAILARPRPGTGIRASLHEPAAAIA